MAIYESLNPDPIFLNPEAGSPRQNLFSTPDAAPRFSIAPRQDFNVRATDDLSGAYVTEDSGDDEDVAVGALDVMKPLLSFGPGHPDALQNKGVTFTDGRTYKSPDFYNVDRSKAASPDNPVMSANVFGKTFSREELEKDEEGRRLLNLMEAERSGRYRDEGFWAGLTNFHDLSGSYKKALADIPFLGWMVDAGLGVSETIDMSKAMKKLQNGEAVSDHEALAVRRYMLQSQMEGQRGIGYNAGSLIHSSIPFAAEMAMSSAAIAAATGVGMAVGGPIGALIAAGGALLFGGGARLLTKAGRASLGLARGTMKTGLAKYATRAVKDGFDREAVSNIMKASMEASGMSAPELVRTARTVGHRKAMAALGREAAERKFGAAEVASWTEDRFIREAEHAGISRKAIRDREKFETLKHLASSYKDTVSRDVLRGVDVGLARYLLVEGDVANKFDAGLTEVLKTHLLNGVNTTGKGYFETQKALRDAYRNLADKDVLKELARRYVEGVHSGATRAVTALRPGGDIGSELIKDSMSRVFGDVGVNQSLAKDVANDMANRVLRNFDLMYNGSWLGGNFARRFGNWVGDGILDGMMRWDRSIFSGAGTLARSGDVLGGKMAVLKEALKASFVEAPVRGAMQMVAQAPLWPLAAMASGHSASDVTIRGQLGVQMQALQTGDKELMDHARAIALGSGVVEYISENAGRGISMLAGGVAKPVLGAFLEGTPLPKATREFGSWMARRVEAVFGTEKAMKAGANGEVAKQIYRSVTSRAADIARASGGTAPRVPFSEIEALVANRSARGLRGLQEFMAATGVTERRLISDAYAAINQTGKMRSALTYFTAYYMMKHGVTPQKMATMLERVGYDGVLSEMAEERYGGFFQGLLGLDERPSDEGIRGRLQAAFEGLFPDRKQLVTEALGFAFPIGAKMSLNMMYSGIGKGFTSDVRGAANGLAHHMRSTPTASIGGLSVDEANAIRDSRDGWERLIDEHFGTAESNRAAITGNAADLAKRMSSGTFSSTKTNDDLKAAKSEDEIRTALDNKAAQIINEAGDDAGALEAALAKYDAFNVFGPQGVEAIRNTWRRAGNQDSKTEALYAETGALGEHLARSRRILQDIARRRSSSATTVEVADELTAQIPAMSNDRSMASDVENKFGDRDKSVRVNDYADDVVGDFVQHLDTLATHAFRYTSGRTEAAASGGWFSRFARGGMMRFIGIANAVLTSDLSLASTNPVQWAMMDAGLPVDMMNRLASIKRESVMVGRKIVIERLAADTHNKAELDRYEKATDLSDFDEPMLRQFEEAGDQYYRERLDSFARAYLAARNVYAVSNSELREEALRVVADSMKSTTPDGRTVYGAAKVSDIHDDRFVSDPEVQARIEQARADIISTIVEQTTNGVIAYNTHDGFGQEMVTHAAYDYRRAMQYGTSNEIIAALRRMPSFRFLGAVNDLSYGRALGDQFGGAAGRLGDVDELLQLPADSRLWTDGQVRSVMVAMGREYTTKSDEENRRDGQRWLRRLEIAVANQAPRHVTRDGEEVDVTFDQTLDRNGHRVVQATVYDKSGIVEWQSAPSTTGYAAVARDLESAGYTCEMPKVVLMENMTFSSSDATSMALFLLGDRNAARDYFMNTAGIAEERFLPPYLRKKNNDWEYDEIGAAEEMKRELRAARNGDEGAKLVTEGSGKADDPFRWGYESAARKYLETRQITRNAENRDASAVVGEATYWVNTSALPVGNTLFITSDYYSEGDGEALLRSALSQAIYQSMLRNDATHLNHEYVMGVYREMNDAFSEAAESLATELDETNPAEAARVRAVLTDLDIAPGRVSPARLAAMAAAMVFFTSDRGVNGVGNGFLMSPELALIADRARNSKWTPLFFSVVDRALGGSGLFADSEVPVFAGLAPLVEAFSPTGAEIEATRKSSLFSGNRQDAAPVTYAHLTWDEARGSMPGFAPVFSVDTMTNLGNVERGAYVRVVATECNAFAKAYKANTGDALTEERMYQLMKQTDEKGGDTAGEARPKIASVSVNGVHHTLPSKSPSARLAAHVIDDETAFAIARSLRFLNETVMTKPVSAEAGRVEARASFGDIKEFLLRRGMRADNINRVLLQARNAFGADDRVRTDTSDDETRDDVAETVSSEGNAELAQSEHASNAVVTSRDLISLSGQLAYVMPSSGGNYTAALGELSSELLRFGDAILNENYGGDLKKLLNTESTERTLYLLGRYFNVLRTGRAGFAEAEIAKSQPWSDVELTNEFLDTAIVSLHDNGWDTFAFVLSALRHMDASGKRRTQALQQIAMMDQHGVNQVVVGVGSDGDVRMDLAPVNSGGRVSMDAIRAVANHLVLSPVFKPVSSNPRNHAHELQSVCYGIWALNNNPHVSKTVNGSSGYRQTNFDNRGVAETKNGKMRFPDGLTGKTVAEFDAKIARAVADQTELLGKVNAILAAGEHDVTLAEHEILVEFGLEFAARYASVADAIDYVFGADNEICRALRGKELARQVTSDIERNLSPSSTASSRMRKAMNRRIVKDFEATGGYTRNDSHMISQLFDRIVSPVVNGAAFEAIRAVRPDTPVDQSKILAKSIRSAGVTRKDFLNGFFRSDLAIMYYHSDLLVQVGSGETAFGQLDRSRFLASPETYSSSSRSTVARILDRYYQTLPRSTAKVTGTSTAELTESAAVTVVTPSPEPVQDRIVDRLFSKMKTGGKSTLKDEFLGNGRRFRDGSELVVVTAGAKEGQEIVDKSLLSMIVYRANRARFEKNLDTRNVYFELYHGEKPTVLSLALPWYAVDIILSDIAAGAEYTRNPELERILGNSALPKALSEMSAAQAPAVYDAVFSVLAKNGGFEYITTKRTQVVLSNATPVPGYREYRDVMKDGVLVREQMFSTNRKTGETVVPGSHFCLSVSGADATQNLGMYFHWGQIHEGQRRLQSNPDALSQKNHIVSRTTEMLTKGQAHAIGLGIYEDEPRYTTGVFAEAQRVWRRKLERILGLRDGILDLPTEEQKKDTAYIAERDAAVADVEKFGEHSSLLSTDHETQKCGPLAGGCGFAAEEGGAIHATIGGKDVWVRVGANGWEGRTGQDTAYRPLSYDTIPEHKGGAYATALVIPAMMETLGLKELSETDVYDAKAKTGIESDWVDAAGRKTSGTLAGSGMFHNLGTAKGDKLSFRLNETGGYECDFFTREIEAQVMANSDAPSKLSHAHPAATNYDRDVVANARRALAGDGPALTVTLARMTPYLIVKANDAAFEEAVLSRDAEFYAAFQAHPNSESLQLEYARKRDALMAKMQRAYVASTHAVLCGSGIKCSFKRRPDGTYDIDYAYSAGVTDYDKSTFQPARVVPKHARFLVGSGRTYSTMRANISGDARFRYGWHVDGDRLDMALEFINKNPGRQELYRSCIADLMEIYLKKATTPEDLEKTGGRKYFHPDAENVTPDQIAQMAALATLIRCTRSSSGDVAQAARETLAKVVVDYTGKHVADNEAVDIGKVSFDDLFQPNAYNGHMVGFDYAALECGSHMKLTPENTDGGQKPAVYLGGSFFSGDRRPSGNFEAASGYARVQAPVTFDAQGRPGPSALYILDPAMCNVQGADTDGDSTTGTAMDGSVTDTDKRFLETLASKLTWFANEYLENRRHADIGERAREIFNELYAVPAYRPYFKKDKIGDAEVLQLSDRFNQAIGNSLLQAQGDNYRNTATLLFDNDGNLVDAGDLAEHEVLNVELNGASRVGPSAMKVDSPRDGGPAFPMSGPLADQYRRCTGKDPSAGMSFDDAFKAAINGLSGKVKPNLLSAYDHAMFSGEAADGSGARGVMVSIQAAFEHLAGYQGDAIRRMCPALYDDIERGVLPFVAHLDGISNSLFDVVKDLFAPRCGWRKNMLNYLVSRLMGRLDEDYKAAKARGGAVKIDHEWFFAQLVGYAEELHREPTSITGLLGKYHAGNNYGEVDPATGKKTFIGVYQDHLGDELMQAFFNESNTGLSWYKKRGSDTPLPDILQFNRRDADGTREVTLTGGDFFDAFNEQIDRACRIMLSTCRKFRKGEATDFQLKNLRGALQLLSPSQLSKCQSDAEAVNLAARVFTILLGGVDGAPAADRRYHVGKDLLTALRGYILFGGAEGVEDRIFGVAADTIRNMLEFDTLMEFEDVLSPDSTYARGGSKVPGLRAKVRRSIKRDVVDKTVRPVVMQFAQTEMRLRDMATDAVHPITVATAASRESDEIDRILGIEDPGERYEAYNSYLDENGVEGLYPGKDSLKQYALAQLLVRGRKMTPGGAAANYGYLQHLPGAIRLALGSMTAEELSGLVKGGALAEVSDIVARLSEEAGREAETGILTQEGGLPRSVTALFRMLRVDPATGVIDFMSNLGPEDARLAREGFKALSAYTGAIYDVASRADADAEAARLGKYRFFPPKFPVRTLTGTQLAALMRIEIARTLKFDAANDLETRANIAQMFGSETDEMERWGAAAAHDLTMRTLMNLPLAGDGGFNLLAGTSFTDASLAMKACTEGGLTGVDLNGMAEVSTRSEYLDVQDYADIIGLTPFDLMLEMVAKPGALMHSYASKTRISNPDFAAAEIQPAPVASPYAQDGAWGSDFTLVPRTRVNGVKFVSNGTEYDTLEDAVNEYVKGVFAELMATPEFAGAVAGDLDLARAVARQIEIGGPRAIRLFVDSVVKDTLDSPEYGELFQQWLVDADANGGDSLVDPLAARQVKEALHEAARARPAARPRIGVRAVPADRAPTVTFTRMKRSDFFDFAKAKDPETFRRMSKNPLEAIKYALEKAFGKWSDETGVKVERVSRKTNGKYVPVNLIRVTRKVKDKSGVRNVTTYISFGDAIAMSVSSGAYMESMLEAINSGLEDGDRAMTLDELKSMTEAQRLALANSLNLRVLGESRGRRCVTTDALLAMTGLIRLSDSADFFTLFHEYFHQTLDFFRDTGVCTDEDMEELRSRYHNADGTFNEEAAADAFSAFLLQDDPSTGAKLLADGAGDRDKLFEKMKHTAQAYLAGALAYDSSDVPVFMKMIISADFTEREMQHVENTTENLLKDIERALLDEDFDYGFKDDYTSPEATTRLHDARLGVQNAMLGFRHGTTAPADVARAAQRYIDELARPENRIVFDGVLRLYGPESAARAPGRKDTFTPVEIRLRDKSVPDLEKVRLFMTEALARFGNGTLAPEYQRVVTRISDVATWDMSEVQPHMVSAVESAARTVLRQTADVLGLNIEEETDDGKGVRLTELGRLLVSDQRVVEMALRLLQEGTAEMQAKPSPDGAPRKAHASAADVVGSALAGVAPHLWGSYARSQADLAAGFFRDAADDCRANAEALRKPSETDGLSDADEQKVRALEEQATTLDRRAELVGRVLDAVARGKDLSKIVPAGAQHGTNLYDYVLRFLIDSSEKQMMMNGHYKYAASESSRLGLNYDGRYVQLALDATAGALAVAAVVRRKARENGVDLPAIGADVVIPDDAVEPPPPGVYEPDVTPQIILQTRGGWLASDLNKKFYGGNLREMLTDTSLQSVTEEANRLASNITFLFGANVEEGGRLNKMDTATSILGISEDGTIRADRRFAHTGARVAAVRGYAFGLINRAAETVGEVWDTDDVNNVNIALQLVYGMMTGEPMVTGYDVGITSARRIRQQLKGFTGATIDGLASRGNVFSPENVVARAQTRVDSSQRPSNLDVLLERMLEGFGKEFLGWDERAGRFSTDGIFCRVLAAFVNHASDQVTDVSGAKREVTDAELWDAAKKELMDAGLIAVSTTGKTVLTIPVDLGEKSWLRSRTYRKLVDAGRSPELLDLHRVAGALSAEANHLHRVASRSRFLRDHNGAALSPAARSGMFFEAGTGFHRLIVDSYANARSRFLGRPSADEVLRTSFASLQETIDRDEKTHYVYQKDPVTGKIVKDADGKPVVVSTYRRGDSPAFERNADGYPTNISLRQIQFLARLLGFGNRASMETITQFLDQIEAGQFKRENSPGSYGFDIDPDMTVADFDRLLFNVVSTLLTEEELGKKTTLTASDEDGGLGYNGQQLVDLREMNRKLAEKLMANSEADDVARGRLCTLSDLQAFRTFGLTGSARTAPERLMSMAESIVHAERFRGCLAQMLTTVGSDGTPNYVVNPTDAAADFMPDDFWAATSRFVLDRVSGIPGMPMYDSSATGLKNMQAIAKKIADHVKTATDNRKPVNMHLLPPDRLHADNLFSEIVCRLDADQDDPSVLNKTAGSEAAGYLKQLFGSLYAPSRVNAWRTIDRLMGYSKAASVGLSAFFAIATRFESPVAACGFMNTATGFYGWTSSAMRKLADSPAGKAMGMEKNMPFLHDFLDSLTSDDPAIRDMRMLLDTLGMSMSDPVQNPMDGNLGNIDSDIKRIYEWISGLGVPGCKTTAKEVRAAMRAAFHNPGEYSFSNVLNGVKMAVVAQTLVRLRRECEQAGRPFDPIRELRRHSAYINAEIGGIQAERYAWLTPGMQRFLRLAMFSYNWTLGAWTAGTGEVVSDLLFGGHNTTPAMRQRAFVRWLRMLGIIKVGVPMFAQLAIRGIAGALTKFGVVGDPDDPDDRDPLGIKDMPYFCFFNESKIGALSIDVTPILKLCGRSETLKEIRLGKGGWPMLTTVAGAAALPVLGGITGFLTGGLKGAASGVSRNSNPWAIIAGAGLGRFAGNAVPAQLDTGRGPNSSGRRRTYIHFGKQSDEFWRWFTDHYSQLTSKLSIPFQKTVEAFFGTVNGGSFGRKFDDMSIADRFLTLSLDPNESAYMNFLSGFTPFSAASVAGHPDAGVFGLMSPVQMGMSKTLAQKRIKARLMDFAELRGAPDIWSSPRNKRNLQLLCSDIAAEARLNGFDPKELIQSAYMEVMLAEYYKLMTSLPKEKADTFDERRADNALRAMFRVNGKMKNIKAALKKRYLDAGVDWDSQKNKGIRLAVKQFLSTMAKDPYADLPDGFFDQFFTQYDPKAAARQAGKGGDGLSNFLATDDVPPTLFGVPIVADGYTDADLEFFDRNPEAGGYYDLGE